MKTTFFKFASAFIVLASVLLFTSCESKPEDNPVDKAAINTLVTECETLLASATITDYPQAAITTFKETIDGVKSALGTANQTQVNNLFVQLTNAKEAFLASAYGAIPADAVLASWDFEEGTGDVLTAKGAKGLKATLTAGPTEIFGAAGAKPTFVSGVKGKGLNFQKGGHLVISNYTNADLLGKKMSFSAWVKPDSTKGGNYVMSFNYWNNWKVQIQEQNKLFLTVATNTGISDMDNEADNSAPNNTWTHIAVVLDLDAHTVGMFINGVLTKSWDASTKGPLAGTAQAAVFEPFSGFFIGSSTSYAHALANFTSWEGWKTPSGWDHFVGVMDNIALYNIALTEGQVSKLYNDQKAQ